jgi:glycosyltransferase involved in cell wall biosynthesis
MPGQIDIFLLAEQMKHRHYVLASTENRLPLTYLPGWRWHHPPDDDRHLNDVRPILRGGYDVLILSAWDEPTYLLLWAWALARRIKVLFWIESTAYDYERSGVKEAYKRLLLKGAAGCIVPGQRAQAYCQQLGVLEERIFIAPNAVDRSYFRARAEALLPKREVMRSETALRTLIVLFVGRLVDAFKDVSTLIRACAQLERRGLSLSLLLAGDGPDREHYQKLAQQERLADVRFLGILDHDTLCRYYAMADVLILPSRSEPWGFVLNEGMEFALPLIVSEAVGAGPDLVQEGKNGFIVPVSDPTALAEALERLASDDALRRRMGEASQAILQNFSPEHWAEGVLQAVESVTTTRLVNNR